VTRVRLTRRGENVIRFSLMLVVAAVGAAIIGTYAVAVTLVAIS
jgi:hypothetical protein